MELTKDKVQELSKLPTGNIADSVGPQFVMNSAIKPIDPKSKMVGRAVTVNCFAGDNLALHQGMSEAKSTYMVTGKDRVYVDHINEPISISGVQVCPGDLICADNTGVVVVPFKRAEEVLKVAHEIEAVEQQIMAKIEAGMTLKEARQQTGYHKLQTPED